MELRAGQKLQSAVCDGQFVVVRAPAEAVDLRCGGAAVLAEGDEAPAGAQLDESVGDAALLGKRYADEELGLEVLCTKAAKGALSLGDQALPLKGAKPLPSSD